MDRAFDTIAGVDYWYKIPAAIESEGGKVFVAKINAFESSAKRGEELIAQLDSIRAASGGKISKFNIMGHSQGGLTARYVMNVRPDLVASLTTLHSPHTGSPVADFITGIAPASTYSTPVFNQACITWGDATSCPRGQLPPREPRLRLPLPPAPASCRRAPW